jgi:5,10-methylene-tetrahydrofolate dehydrogenase/methenyl tetrahydrofolate cyclohydrolase
MYSANLCDTVAAELVSSAYRVVDAGINKTHYKDIRLDVHFLKHYRAILEMKTPIPRGMTAYDLLIKRVIVAVNENREGILTLPIPIELVWNDENI